jgi:hypothetical protein
MSVIAQRSFGFGEVSPSQYAATDRAFYRQALKTLLNGYVMRGGGLQSRPGTVYKGASKSNGAAQLVECVFDDDQNYVLEFGNAYVRFWKDGAQVTGTSIGSWANGVAYAAGIVLLHSGTYYVCLQAHTSATANDRPNDGTNRTDYWYALSGLIYELPTDYGTSILKELQFVATLGVLRIAHNTVPLQKLVRVANAQWYFAAIASAPTLDFPTNLATDAPTPGDVAAWCVTAYDSVNGIESLASSPVSSDTAPASPSDVFTQTWDAVTGATSYRVYRSDNLSVFGLLYETTSTTYIDTGSRTPDLTTNPPEQQSDFSAAGDYPGVIGAYQQRLFHTGSVNEPDVVRGSKSGAPDDFTVSSPLVDSDAVSFRMLNARVVRGRHFVEVARSLLMLANVGEVAVEGDDSGIVTPGGINPRFISQNGAAEYPAPLAVNGSALYVQARGGVVRDLLPDSAGSDLTVLSSHLIEGYTIVDWCYQQTPHSVVWAVRSDGVLLSLTYQRETSVFAWARHTTDGTVESVACVPESTEDAVYLLVNRTINGGTVRYLERLANRAAALAAFVGSDASTTVSGAHPHSTLSMTAGSGVLLGDGYAYSGETATGSGGSGSFTSADVGRTFSFVYNSVRGYGIIVGHTSGTVVTVDLWWPSLVELTNPQAFTTGNWWWTSAAGLTHLAAEPVSVWRDSVVLASPNNPDAPTTVTVTTGGVAVFGGLVSGYGNVADLTPTGDTTTDAYTTAIVGLPFVVDVQTLAIDSAGSSRMMGNVHISTVGLWLESSFTPWVGPEEPTTATSLTTANATLQQMPMEDDDQNATTTPITGFRDVTIDGAWTPQGSIFLRHVDPTPLTVLAIIPSGDFGRSS